MLVSAHSRQAGRVALEYQAQEHPEEGEERSKNKKKDKSSSGKAQEHPEEGEERSKSKKER